MIASSLSDLLCDAGMRYPERPALVTPTAHLSYGEFHRRASSLAATLIESGIRPGDRVIICLPKGPELAVAIFGTLLAGGCYVPIDFATPTARILLLARDAEPGAIICPLRTGRGLFDDLLAAMAFDEGEVSDRQTFVFVPSPKQSGEGLAACVHWERALASAPLDSPVRSGPNDRAYILYTSGSTGRPKGVVHTHESALAFANWAADNLRLTATDVLSQHASPSFDLTIFDFFSSARAAAALVSVPEWMFGRIDKTIRFIVEKKITVWYSVPSALLRREGVAGFGALSDSSLRRVVFAGEVIPVNLLREFMACLPPGCTVSNWYGPTETNVITHHDISASDLESDRPIPIGRPCPYAHVRIVPEENAEAGASVQGELWVASPTNMQEYWKLGPGERAAKSRAVDADGRRYYRTGDLVAEEEGRLIFLGRLDRLLKVRGYRLQPEEIEHVLQGHADVSEAAAIAIREEGHEKIGGVVATTRREEELLSELKSFCEELLPPYMVPSKIVRVDALPRNERGKINYPAIEHLFSPQADARQSGRAHGR